MIQLCQLKPVVVAFIISLGKSIHLSKYLAVTLFFLIACSSDKSNDSDDDITTPEANNTPAFKDVATEANLQFTVRVGSTFSAISGGAVTMQEMMGNGAAVGDFDNDGDLDVYLLNQTNHSNRLFRNNLEQGQKTFTDITTPILADIEGFSRVAHFVDLNNDNHLDLLLINDDDGEASTSASKIFRNNGDGSFTDVTADSEFRPIGYLRAGCALADYDLDGLIDIYVTNWSLELGTGSADFLGSNRLYRNRGNFVFEDVTSAAGLDNLARDSFTAIFKDFNHDLYPEIYVAVDHTSDEFYVNNAGVFLKETRSVGTEHIGNDMGVAVADWDDDDDLDLYMTNITDPSRLFGTTQHNGFYINQWTGSSNLSFINKAVEYGVQDTYWGWGTEFTDVENDGDLDLISVTGFDKYVLDIAGDDSPLYKTPSVMFRNDDGVFNKVLSTGLDYKDDSRALVVFDYDRDGDEDLLITNINQPVRLLENVNDSQDNWLHLILKPDNKAIGATVYANFNGVRKRRDIIAGRSYLAGTPSEVHFGLGDATQVNSLTIRWADGMEQTFSNIAANQIIEYVAPSEP